MPPGTNRWIGLQKVFVSKSYCSAVGDKWSKLPGVQNSDNLQTVSRSITMKGRVETLQRRQNVLYEGRNDIALFTECIRFCNTGNTRVEFGVQNMKLLSLTLSSNDLLQKQRASQLLRKFSALYKNRMFFYRHGRLSTAPATSSPHHISLQSISEIAAEKKLKNNDY